MVDTDQWEYSQYTPDRKFKEIFVVEIPVILPMYQHSIYSLAPKGEPLCTQVKSQVLTDVDIIAYRCLRGMSCYLSLTCARHTLYMYSLPTGACNTELLVQSVRT